MGEYIKPVKTAKRKTGRPEDICQMAQVRLLRRFEAQGLLTFFHVPNQLQRPNFKGKIPTAAELKRHSMLKIAMHNLGCQAGVQDLFILLPGKVLAVENKIKGRKPSDDQKNWAVKCARLGITTLTLTFSDTLEAQRQLLGVLIAHDVPGSRDITV